MLDVVEMEKQIFVASVDDLERWHDPRVPGKIHYRYTDRNVPLSPTTEEIRVLFAIARVLRPDRIVEAGTGTGVSAAAMALGHPKAKILTVDDFREGAIHGHGIPTTMGLWRRLGLMNIELRPLPMEDIPAADFVGDILFMDGQIKGHVPRASIEDARLVIEHDAWPFHCHAKLAIQIPTFCHLTLHSHDKELLTLCDQITRPMLKWREE